MSGDGDPDGPVDDVMNPGTKQLPVHRGSRRMTLGGSTCVVRLLKHCKVQGRTRQCHLGTIYVQGAPLYPNVASHQLLQHLYVVFAVLKTLCFGVTWATNADDVSVVWHRYAIGATSTISYVDTGLDASAKYPYPVHAYDAANDKSALSTLVRVSAQSPKHWFVRPSGALGSGTNWTAAWNGFSNINWASVGCGDTIWVAGGTYRQDLVPNKNCTAGNPIFIRRARSDLPIVVNTIGWDSSYDSLIIQSGASIGFNAGYNYIVISGATSASGGSTGWLIDLSPNGAAGGCGICIEGSTDSGNNHIEWLELKGPGEISYIPNSTGARGIDMTPYPGRAVNYTFSHIKIHDWESAIYAVGCDSPVFEWIDLSNVGLINWVDYHPNGLITWDCPSGIVRYGFFHRGTNPRLSFGEGLFFEQAGGSTNWEIYGNIFANIQATYKSIHITSDVGAIKIYNNTFYNVKYGSILFDDHAGCSGGEYINNLQYMATHVTSGGGCTLTASNNTNATSTSVWINTSADNYHIVSTTGANFPRNAGINLGSLYKLDPDGVIRGSDGTWDTGAYEYP